MIYIELFRSGENCSLSSNLNVSLTDSRIVIEIPWHVKVLVKITWRFSQLMLLVPSQNQPAGFAHSDFLRVSFLDLLRWYICISISLKQYFWNLCINFFVLYSQRKESVPLLWQNQMCYSWKAVSLMRTPSFVYILYAIFQWKSQKKFINYISPPWERRKIWPNLAKGVKCTVLHSFAMENGDLIHCIALQKSFFSVTQLLALQK